MEIRVLNAITTLLGSMPPEQHCCVVVGIVTWTLCDAGGYAGLAGVWKGATIARPSSAKPSRWAAILGAICWVRKLCARCFAMVFCRPCARIFAHLVAIAAPQLSQQDRQNPNEGPNVGLAHRCWPRRELQLTAPRVVASCADGWRCFGRARSAMRDAAAMVERCRKFRVSAMGPVSRCVVGPKLTVGIAPSGMPTPETNCHQKYPTLQFRPSPSEIVMMTP